LASTRAGHPVKTLVSTVASSVARARRSRFSAEAAVSGAAQEGCARLHRRGAQRERGYDPARVADAAGRDHGHADGIDDLWHERHRPDLGGWVVAKEHAPVATCLRTLGDHGVAACCGEVPCLGDGRRGGEHEAAGRPDAIDERGCRQPEMEAHDRRLRRHHRLAQRLVEGQPDGAGRHRRLEPALGVVRREPGAPSLEHVAGRSRLGVAVSSAAASTCTATIAFTRAGSRPKSISRR